MKTISHSIRSILSTALSSSGLMQELINSTAFKTRDTVHKLLYAEKNTGEKDGFDTIQIARINITSETISITATSFLVRQTPTSFTNRKAGE